MCYPGNILLSAAVRELSRLEYSSSEDKNNIVLFFGCASEQFNIIVILLAIVLYPILNFVFLDYIV